MSSSDRRSSSRGSASEGTQVIEFPYRAPAQSSGEFPPHGNTIVRPLGAARSSQLDVDSDDELRMDVAAAVSLLDAARHGFVAMPAAIDAAIVRLGGQELLDELRAFGRAASMHWDVTPAGREALDNLEGA